MRALIIILSMVTLLGCGTQPQLAELVNDMVVLTNYDDQVDYNQYVTYTMPMDTIGFISNTSSETALSNSYAQQITAQIRKNLDQTNHQMVDPNADPDIGVNVFIVNDLSVFQTTYPGYYNPSSYGYYGYGGYGGYGYTTINTFQQAVLVIEFLDLKSTASEPPSVWVANIGDLVNSYDTSQKTKEAIDQAFQQSQFLKRQ